MMFNSRAFTIKKKDAISEKPNRSCFCDDHVERKSFKCGSPRDMPNSTRYRPSKVLWDIINSKQKKEEPGNHTVGIAKEPMELATHESGE